MLLSYDAQGSPTHKELSDQNVDKAKVKKSVQVLYTMARGLYSESFKDSTQTGSGC